MSSPLHRPPQPALDSGRVQKRIRRAYVATAALVDDHGNCLLMLNGRRLVSWRSYSVSRDAGFASSVRPTGGAFAKSW